MDIEGCRFPEDVLYDRDGLTWARVEPSGLVTVGVTSILAALAGRLTSIRPKPAGVSLERGRAVATMESETYFGSVRAPLSGVLEAANAAVLARPKACSEDPYGEGWLVRLRPSRLPAERADLLPAAEAAGMLRNQITALRVRCFTAFPDHEMFEIGSECAAVLVKLDELVARIPAGEVVHIVSDDWTAPAEMENWSERTGHPVVDSRREGNLFHFLVRKAS